MPVQVDAAPVDVFDEQATPTRSRAHRVRRWVVVAAIVLLLPVPWQYKTDSTLGIAWGMDNRLLVEGQRLDPPGRYSWLTAGRPALVAELAWQRVVALVDGEAQPVSRDLRAGSARERPVNVEPLSAAVGLAAAKGAVPSDGSIEPVDALMGGHGPPYDWIRKMSMGASHGLMVGLVTYVAVSGDDLAAGWHVAGTGQLYTNGAVGTIGGLTAKADGARRAGADVLLVPALQLRELDGFDAGEMQVIGVYSIHDAIKRLRAIRDARAKATADYR